MLVYPTIYELLKIGDNIYEMAIILIQLVQYVFVKILEFIH